MSIDEIMSNVITISDEAYEEIIDFINKKGARDHNVRIAILGGRCSGPIFNLTVSEIQANDVISKVKDISFIISRALIDECAGFRILSSKENNSKSIAVKPFNPAKKDCKSCGRGCP